MMAIINATEAKQNFGHCLMNVAKEPIVIKKSGREAAVLISYEEYQRFLDLENQMLYTAAMAAEKEGFLDEQKSSEFFDRMNERYKKTNP